jgi:hypothetical protein
VVYRPRCAHPPTPTRRYLTARRDNLAAILRREAHHGPVHPRGCRHLESCYQSFSWAFGTSRPMASLVAGWWRR